MSAADRLLAWLLDLEHIRIGTDAPLILKWGREVPAWVLLCFALVVLTHVVLVYRRERTTVLRRTVLVVLRCAIIAVIASVLCEPSLFLQRNRVEASHVALLLDTSLSMATHDHYADESARSALARGAGLESAAADRLARESRLELVRSALLRDDAAPLRRLLERNGIHLLTFAGGLEGRAYAPPRSGPDAVGDGAAAAGLGPLVEAIVSARADGLRTDVPGALAGLVDGPSSWGHADAGGERGGGPRGDRLAAVILATDGQSTPPLATGADSPSGRGRHDVHPRLDDVLEAFADRAIPILSVRIGSTVPPRDLAVGQLRAAETVFMGDEFTVEAQLTAQGLTEPTTVLVSLLDERGASPEADVPDLNAAAAPTGGGSMGIGGTTVAGRSIELGPESASVTVELRTKPARAGVGQYRVAVTALPGERITENNSDRIDVKVIDDRLRVLFVEAYPRYEYRYLKNALLREKNMDLSVLLLEADEQFVQEGTEPIRRFPETPEELDRYDVVFFGDVDPRAGWLTAGQMNMLLDFVGNRGGGFALIAGERSAPHRFPATPLEKLVPVIIDPAAYPGSRRSAGATGGEVDAGSPAADGFSLPGAGARPPLGFRPNLTPEGRQSRVFRFAADREQNERLFESLPELYWAARTLGARPGATVLAEHPTERTASGPMPIVVTGRYGAGRIFFQATDDTWRWRRHTGELLHDAYWVQVARELMGGARVASGRSYLLRTDRSVFEYGAPVRAQIEILDRRLLGQQEEVIEVTAAQLSGPESVASPEDASAERRDVDAGRRQRIVGRFNLHRVGPESSLFEGTFVPPGPGSFSLDAVDLAGHRGPEPVSGPSDAAVGGVPFRVNRPDLETRRLEADHAVLERIAAATGGRVVDLDQLEDAFGQIRDRSVQIPDDVTEPLWDSKLVLALFASMISMEWGLRKVFGLL